MKKVAVLLNMAIIAMIPTMTPWRHGRKTQMSRSLYESANSAMGTVSPISESNRTSVGGCGSTTVRQLAIVRILYGYPKAK